LSLQNSVEPRLPNRVKNESVWTNMLTAKRFETRLEKENRKGGNIGLRSFLGGRSAIQNAHYV